MNGNMCPHSEEWWDEIQRSKVLLLSLVLRGYSRKQVREIIRQSEYCFPYLRVFVTTVPQDTDEWRAKINASLKLFSGTGFHLRFAIVEGSPLLFPLTKENTQFYPKNSNNLFERRRYLERFAPCIISDDDSGRTQRIDGAETYKPSGRAGFVIACKAFKGGGHQDRPLLPDAFFFLCQVLFFIGKIEGVAYVGLNASKQGTRKVRGYRGSGKKQSSHASYSVFPVSYDAAITGWQGVLAGVRDSSRYRSLGKQGVKQEFSTASAEAVAQGILLGRHGTLTLRCVRCVYAISALKAGVPNDAVQLHETYSFVLTANTAKGTDVKTGCIVKFSTTQSERHAITLKVNSL